MTKVACIGECMVEVAMPRPGAERGRVDFAGDTFNTAVYLKRLAPSAEVAYVTALGTDPVSDQMAATFAAEGLGTDLIERREGRAPGLYAISLDASGERSFTYWRDQSAARTLFHAPAEVTPAALRDFDLVYLSGITVAILAADARAALKDALHRVRVNGGSVAFDSNYRPRLWPDQATARAEITAFWNLADVGLPSLDDELALYGEACEAEVRSRLVSGGVRRGALKRGDAGPIPIGPAGTLPPFARAARVVDTTAAGDSFNGGYLAAYIHGEDEAACLAAGHAMASEVVGHPGAIIPR
ncbi:2-dehydro-3-deoxygluconokinase [Amaricoccus macauensis]|uniref:2-dehydro-3-deoxygluconokinase n=1 Tax=Amaricoccus macauensis TaxID=57001 RepID=A0A840SDD7_9RHOB|nr:sugar kinase [Amaricoccus macauensis]MBB5220849.1 2-dehydro-3-deoxygluconokinase [Amaricoccus macauensis]